MIKNVQSVLVGGVSMLASARKTFIAANRVSGHWSPAVTLVPSGDSGAQW